MSLFAHLIKFITQLVFLVFAHPKTHILLAIIVFSVKCHIFGTQCQRLANLVQMNSFMIVIPIHVLNALEVLSIAILPLNVKILHVHSHNISV